MANSARFRIQATAPYSVDVVSSRFARLTGLFVVGATIDQTFSYTLLTPTAYFDVVASQLHRGVPDDSSSGTVRDYYSGFNSVKFLLFLKML